MNITTTPKRSRALPRVWERFIYLEPGDGFFIGRCAYEKTGFFRAITAYNPQKPERAIYLPPWRKVQTDVLVRDARPGGKLSFAITPAQEACPGGPSIGNPGVTHFVGDDCPGGHADPPVNNDNDITGPTS